MQSALSSFSRRRSSTAARLGCARSTGDESLAEQTLGGLERPSKWGALRRSRPVAGHRALSHRGRALGAEIFIKLAGGEDEQQFFADRLGDPAFRTIEFGGNELRHTV